MNVYTDDRNAGREARSLVKAIACAMVLTAGLLAPMERALATEGGKNTNLPDTNGTCDSNDPVILYDGAATEGAVDLSLPGVTLGWEHGRHYNSGLVGGEAIQGEKWIIDQLGMFFLAVDGSNNIELYRDYKSKRVFSPNAQDQDKYDPPADYLATLTHNPTTHLLTLKHTDTGETYTFYDLSNNWPSHQQGVLKEQTDRYGLAKLTYIYDTDVKRIITVTTTQGWMVTYTYDETQGSNRGKLLEITVKNASSKVIQKAKYTYYASACGYSTEVGSDGDLIMVEVLKRGTNDNLNNTADTDFAIRRTTMYRYYRDGDAGGNGHQLKTKFDPEPVSRMMSSKTASELLGMDDDGIVAGALTVESYANVKYTYYTTHTFDTDDLESLYGGGDLDEFGFVKTQTIYKDYKGFLGTRTYYYMENDQPGNTDLNHVTRIVLEDTSVTGTRNVYGLNSERIALRKIFIHDLQSPKYWCRSFVMGYTKDGTTNNYNRIVEECPPSAHTCVDTDGKVRDFLDAVIPADWTSSIKNTSSGKAMLYDYNDQGHLTKTRVKDIATGNAYYLSVTVYGDGSSGKPKYLPTDVYIYPAPTTAEVPDPDTRLHTEFTYSLYDNDPDKLESRTVTKPLVTDNVTAPGYQATTKEYFDRYGRLRWTKDAEGHVNYYSYNPDTGGMACVAVDVNTTTLSGTVSGDGGGKWIAWSGSVPTGFGNASTTPLELVYKIEYDDIGQVRRTEDAEGVVTSTAYGANEIRVYSGWNSGTSTTPLPIVVTRTNNDELTTDVYSLDPAGVTIGANGGLPTGSDSGESQSDYITWTHYSYNTSTALLEIKDDYHDIPGSGGGTLSTNFHRTFYRYDALGRRTHTIQVVSGTSVGEGVEQVTKLEYDNLDRVIATYQARSGENDNLGTGYATEAANLKKVSSAFYDESTPGSGTAGVGDGLVTSALSFYDSANVDADHAVKTIYWRDYRGRLRGIEPESSPYTVRDVDNLGRVVASAMFTTEPTWTGESGVVKTENFAATTTTSRKALAEICYDAMGRVYRTKAWTLNSSTGDKAACLMRDFYYDRDSRLVAEESAGAGSVEYAYDAAGRGFETRVVKALNSAKYSSGAFDYCAPEPGASSGGNEGVIKISRVTLDKVGNVTESYTFEMNHNDTTSVGIQLDGSDFVRTTTFNWYEPSTHRLATSAYYGSGASTWANATAPSRPTYVNRPTASDSEKLVTGYAYSNGRLDTVTDPNGIDTKYTYDDLDRIVKVEEDEGGVDERTTLAEYDGLGNTVRQIADVDNDDSTFSGGKWTTDDDDQITTYSFTDSYDSRLMTQIQYPDGDGTDDNVKFTYWLDGQPHTRTAQKKTNETANVLTYEYDGELRRLARQRVTTDGTGVDVTVRCIVYSYDIQSRREKISSYSQANPTVGTDIPINEVKYHFTDFGAILREYQAHNGAVDDDGSGGDTPAVEYAYETTTDTVNGQTTVYTKALRLTSVTYPNGRKSFYDYGTSGGIDYALSRVAAIKDDDGSGSTGCSLAAYSYNGTGRLVIEDFVKPVGATAPEIRLDYYGQSSGTYAGFDRFGRVVQQCWYDYGATADRDRYAYGYDYNSNRQYRENAVATAAGKKLSETYAYDNLNRLVDFKRGKITSGAIPTTNSDRLRGEAWTLNATGNWDAYKVDAGDGSGGAADGDYSDSCDLDQGRTHNAANEIANATAGAAITEAQGQTAWADPAHDSRGNMTSTPRPGDMTALYVCTYDAWNRLVKVAAGEATVAEYRYDGLNRRIRKFTEPSGDNWTVRGYYYNTAWQTMEVCKETKTRTGSPLSEPAVAAAVYEQYVWSLRYIDAPILRDRDAGAGGDLGKTGSGLDERLYYLSDLNMNVTALVNTGGEAVERYAYDPYGQVTIYDGNWSSRSSSSHDNEILYCGYRFDGETGLYHVRNRVYHPLLGRWLQRDPLGYVDGMSLYEYCGTNPLLHSDPLGRSFWSIVGNFAAGVVVGAVVAAVVIVAAPVVAAAGAAALVAAGATAATATAVSTGVVTFGLMGLAATGVAVTTVNTINAVEAGDWDTAAYNAGGLVGALAVGGAGGRVLSNKLSPVPSKSPPLYKPCKTWKYEMSNNYHPGYINPDGTRGSLFQAFSKGPTPAGAAFAVGTAGAGGAAAAADGNGGGGGR